MTRLSRQIFGPAQTRVARDARTRPVRLVVGTLPMRFGAFLLAKYRRIDLWLVASLTVSVFRINARCSPGEQCRPVGPALCRT